MSLGFRRTHPPAPKTPRSLFADGEDLCLQRRLSCETLACLVSSFFVNCAAVVKMLPHGVREVGISM